MIVSELDRLVERATQLHAAGDPAGADALLREVLFLDPAHVMALAVRGELAVERHDAQGAIMLLGAAVRAEPGCAPALSHMAHALWLAGRMDEAVAMARRACDAQPTNPQFRVNYAQTLAWSGDSEGALAAPGDIPRADHHGHMVRARAWCAVGEALTARGDFEAALAAFERGIEIAPEYDLVHMGYAMAALRLGRFEDGWRSYARRERIPFFYPLRTAGLPGRRWQGESLAGAAILLRDDQGYGDAIQFFRYLPQIAARRPARIVWSTFEPLAALFAASTSLAEIVSGTPPGFEPDYHCMTADLPGAMGTRLDRVPQALSYLRAPDAALRARPRPSGNDPRVGLVWSGDPRHMNDRMRSCPASVFLALADLRGIEFVGLQKEIRESDMRAVAARGEGLRAGESLGDFADTAAIIAGLDLVVSVDTSVAHLAAALGKPVWLLLPLASEWRWLTDRDDSPWYPTMRIFRSGRDGWPPLVGRVARELGAWADAHRSGVRAG